MIRALFGGSFDPVHAGHVAIVDLLLARGLADMVHVVPARQSPLKDPACAAAARHRLAMLQLALAGRGGVLVDNRELFRPGPSYTVDTLAELNAGHPDACWRLVVGGDHARAFGHWRDPERLLSLAEVVVVSRGPLDVGSPLAGRVRIIDDFDHPAAATDLRRELAAGRRPEASLLPAAVTDYIVTHRLYGWPATGGTS